MSTEKYLKAPAVLGSEIRVPPRYRIDNSVTLSYETVQQKSFKDIASVVPMDDKTHDVRSDTERSAHAPVPPFSVFRRSTPFRAGAMPPPSKISRFVHPSASDKFKAPPQIPTPRMFPNVPKHLNTRFGDGNSSHDPSKNADEDSEAFSLRAVQQHESHGGQLLSTASNDQNQQTLQLPRVDFNSVGYRSDATGVGPEAPSTMVLEPPTKRRRLAIPDNTAFAVMLPETIIGQETGRLAAGHGFVHHDITGGTRTVSGQSDAQHGVMFDQMERERRQMHWASCEMDQWLAGGKEIMARFEALFHRVEESMKLDLDCFDDLDGLFAEHERNVLSQNETVLGQVKETILSASTHLLSNTSDDRQT
ncbi:hypothetical protein CPB86DRAFT_793381 [Serendipita vermifera]|nr:hypothetical protein CPB86DRAFT_793381 [Serendipita vermifera]